MMFLLLLLDPLGSSVAARDSAADLSGDTGAETEFWLCISI